MVVVDSAESHNDLLGECHSLVLCLHGEQAAHYGSELAVLHRGY